MQLDADGQHDPAEVKLILAALDEGADMSVGSRFASHESTYDVGRVRFGAMRALRLAVLVFAGQRFTDTSSGFRAFTAPVVRFFAETYPQEYMESVEALLLACHAGLHGGGGPGADASARRRAAVGPQRTAALPLPPLAHRHDQYRVDQVPREE